MNFALVSRKDGDRGDALAPAQLAGGSALIVKRNHVGRDWAQQTNQPGFTGVGAPLKPPPPHSEHRHRLLDKAAKKRGWTLVPELSTHSGGKRVVPDGTVRDEFRLARGWWEAKDTSDNLASEIQKKLKAGYPTRNTIFEDTQTAVLYQDRAEAGEFPLKDPHQVAGLLNTFFAHDESDEREFHRAMEEFKSRIPDLAQSLRDHIDEAHQKNPKFKAAFAEFVTLCRASLNPELTEAKVDEMLIQHLLTERLMSRLFNNPEFTHRNVIAAQVEGVINALASSSFSRADFLKRLDPYYKAIEKAGAGLSHFTEKQDFLNSCPLRSRLRVPNEIPFDIRDAELPAGIVSRMARRSLVISRAKASMNETLSHYYRTVPQLLFSCTSLIRAASVGP